MATTEHFYTGNNSTTSFAFTFPYLSNSDVKVELNNVVKTENSSGQTNNDYTINNTNIVFNSAPGTGVAIHIYRTTNVDSAQAQYAAGSSIRAADLNNNQTQVLYSAQEAAGQKVRQGDLKDSIIGSSNIIDGTITSADLANSLITTEKINTGAVTTAKIADLNVTTSKIENNTITTAKLATGVITTATIANDAVTADKIANGAINSSSMIGANVINNSMMLSNSITTGEITDGNVTTAKIAADAVTTAKIAAGAVDSTELANGAVTSTKLGDDAVTTAKIADNAVDTNRIASNAVTAAKIANETITSSQIANGTITNSDLANNSVGTTKLINDEVTTAKLAPSAIDTSRLAAGAVTTAKLGDDAVTTAKIADDAVDSNRIATNAVTTAKVAASNITNAKLASNAVTESKITDANVTTDKIANDAITIGKIGCEQTTISNSDLHLPTSGAVVDYVAAQIAPIGGLEVIATDAAFPNTQPSAGVVISIADAGGIVVDGSGSSTTGRTVGGSTVTINGINSAYNSSTVTAGVGFLVSSTGSGQIYNFHKSVIRDQDILSISSDINDFGNRYRVGSSNPTSSLDAGDLFFNTSTQKLLVYNSTNSAWEEAQSVGNFFISTFSESFDGSRTAFTVSNSPSNAQQLIISINGVIQKPNSGTGQPSEGFTLSGSTVTFSSAIPSGSDYFAIVLGSTVNIGAPSNGTVTTDKLTSGAVTTAKIADDAVTGDKIATNLDLPDNNKIRLGTGNDLEVFHDGTNSYVEDAGTGKLILKSNGTHVQVYAAGFDVNNAAGTETQLECDENAGVKLYYDNVKKFESHSAGVKVSDGNLYLDRDNAKVVLGASDDLQIYHSGSHSYIQQGGTGQLIIQGNDNDQVKIMKGSSEEGIILNNNGNVELYHNNNKRFETATNGGVFRGTTWTAVDNCKIAFGTGDDLQIYHDGSDSFITNTGTLKIQTRVNIDNSGGSEHIARFIPDSAVELYYDGSKKFQTHPNGIFTQGHYPYSDNTYDLGSGSERWDDVYATNGTIQTSDKNQKNTIVDTDLGLSFINKLKPVSYKFNSRVRTHYGLIAQDVETTLSDISKSTTNFAGFIKENIPDKLYVEDDDIPEGKKVGDVKTAAFTAYGLRYNEFISPLIKAVQELSTEVETLKTKVAALEAA